MNHCRLEKVGTKEYGRMLKRIQVLEKGRICPESRKLENRRTTDKDHKERVLKMVE